METRCTLVGYFREFIEEVADQVPRSDIISRVAPQARPGVLSRPARLRGADCVDITKEVAALQQG